MPSDGSRPQCSRRVDVHFKGSNYHYFSHLCHLIAVALGGCTQKMMSNKTPVSCVHTKTVKQSFRKNLQTEKSFGGLKICLHVDKGPEPQRKRFVFKKIPMYTCGQSLTHTHKTHSELTNDTSGSIKECGSTE